MRKIWKTLGMSAAVSVLCSCAWFGGKPIHHELTEKDSGRTLQLDKEDTFTILLASNPSTGYQWKIDTPSYNKQIITIRDDKFIQPDKQLPGAPGKRSLSFLAEGSGRTGLRLVYVRPWEKNQPPSREFNLVVIVKGKTESK